MIDIRVADKMALSVIEAGKLAGMGKNTLYAAIKKRALKARMSGRRMIVLRSDLETWLQQLPVAGDGKSAPS